MAEGSKSIRLILAIFALSLGLSGAGLLAGTHASGSTGLLETVLAVYTDAALPLPGKPVPSEPSLGVEPQSWMEAKLTRPAAAPRDIVGAAAPADTEYGLDRDQIVEGGEVVAETVNLLYGNVVEARLDLRFPSPNRLGLTFEAFYNSRSAGYGRCGYGWSHSYSARLILPGATSYHEVVDATGRSHYFSESGGVFSGVYQERSRLVASGDGFLWYPLDGSRYRFSSTGVLTWIEDQVGNRLTLGYSAEKLHTVTDGASGRVLTLNYTGNLLTGIDGPASQAVPGGTGWVTFGYTGQDLTSVTYADGSGYRYEYHDTYAHKLTAVRDKVGTTGHLIRSWNYNASNRCVSAVTRNGKGAGSITYVSANEITVVDAYGKSRTYTLASFGGRMRVTSVSHPNAPYRPDNAVSFGYDAQARLTEVGYGGGRVDRFSGFNSRGLPGTVHFAYGTGKQRTVTYTWHPNLNVLLRRSEASVLIPAQKKVTTFDYDDPSASGDDPNVYNENPTRLLRRKIEQGYTKNSAGADVAYKYITGYSYNVKGQIARISGPTALPDYRTDFWYSTDKFNLTNVTRPLIGPTRFSNYDDAGFPRRVTDVSSRATNFTYDGRGRVTRAQYVDGSSKSVDYNEGGDISVTTDEDAVKYSYSYYVASGLLYRLNEFTGDVLGDYVQYTRDTRGNITRTDWVDRQTGQVSRTKSWSYMHPAYPGLLWKEIEPQTTGNPLGTTVYNYYPSGMMSQKTDASGAVTEYDYDVFNRLVTLTEPMGAVTRLTWDNHGNLATVTDAKSSPGVTTYVWDDMGWLVSETTPDSGTTTYGYDRAGNLLWKTDALGVTVNYTYDLLDRLTQVSYPASAGRAAYSIVYTYDETDTPDGKGRLTSVTDPSGETRLVYNNRGRLKSKSSTIVKNDTQDYTFTMSRELTDGGRVTKITYPSGRTLNFERTSCPCRVSKITTTRAGTTKNIMTLSAYRPFGDPSDMGIGKSGNSANVDLRFNLRGELSSANPGAKLRRTFTYTQDGRIDTVAAPQTPRYNRNFDYDDLKRLEHATGPFGQLGYTYDLVGNRLTETANSATTSYSYVPGTNRLSSVGGADYDHDDCGRITKAGTWTYGYNQAGQLVQAKQSGTLKGAYLYNGFSQRAKKTVAGTATYFVYDFDGNLAAEANANGTVTVELLYRGRQRLARATASAIHFFHNNALGTPEMMTDENNKIAWEAIYKPFGTATINTKSTVVNRFRFQGQYQDAETGLHYNWHRYYDPKTGRYLTPDPIGLAGGINPYVYVDSVGKPLAEINRHTTFRGIVGKRSLQTNPYTYSANDPINRIDPLGLQDCPSGQHLELDWTCVLTVNGALSPAILPIWISVPAGVTLFAAGGPFSLAGAGLAVTGAGLFGMIEGAIFSSCYKCIPDIPDCQNSKNP